MSNIFEPWNDLGLEHEVAELQARGISLDSTKRLLFFGDYDPEIIVHTLVASQLKQAITLETGRLLALGLPVGLVTDRALRAVPVDAAMWNEFEPGLGIEVVNHVPRVAELFKVVGACLPTLWHPTVTDGVARVALCLEAPRPMARLAQGERFTGSFPVLDIIKMP